MNINDSTEVNAAGGLLTIVSLLNSLFQMLNPVLTGIFYIASIAWLVTQLVYKVKNKGK